MSADSENRSLYYMAPMRPNAILIATIGAFSYNQIHGAKVLADLVASIADPAVNSRRHRITFEGYQLHDFVPLYWATHTPMQYVITIRDRKIDEDDLVFFVFESDEVLALPGVWTTDGNAASSKTVFYRGAGALPQIDWHCVDTPNAYSREYKRLKCAEVLVPDHIPTELLQEVCVRSEAAADRFSTALREFRQSLPDVPLDLPPVRVRGELYY